LKKKGFKEESMTKVQLYALGTSTTLESNKSVVGMCDLWLRSVKWLRDSREKISVNPY
jgi:hypothetical protein